ncbi:MAG: hypothetical protein H0T89_05820 [Deltaproteobacteria bacterium]|nr:hypothetical protein [Deltaproteobacteria bacterium]MDQ3298151.1 hypothetical protein [Myxococcota bacterium]
MRRLGIVVALVVAASACSTSDDRSGGGPDDPSDNPQEGSFAAFVIDLVQNQTADDTEPVEAAAFAELPDADEDNESAYSALLD